MRVQIDETIDGEFGHGKGLSLASAQVAPSEAVTTAGSVAGGHAPFHGEADPGDRRGLRRGQERHHRRDLVGL